jgi:hypothetical protein
MDTLRAASDISDHYYRTNVYSIMSDTPKMAKILGAEGRTTDRSE